MPNSTELEVLDTEIVEAEIVDAWELSSAPAVERTALEQQIEDQRQQVIANEKRVGAFLEEFAESNPELFHQARATEDDSLRKNTQTSYSYWVARWRRWCEEPSTRHRGAQIGVLAFSDLFPVSINTEAVLRLWLEDAVTGPTDEDSWQEWNERFGKFAPNTLTIIQAAVKEEISKHQVWPWEPTTSFKKWWKGLRNQCRQGHRDRQAEPVTGELLYAIGRHLFTNETPLVARDRVVLEATVAGLTPAEIGRLTLSCVLTDATGTVERTAKTDSGETVRWDEPAMFDGKRLVVPGQVRSNGKRSEGRVLDLNEHSHLATAIESWLAVRDVEGESLLFGDAKNVSDRARKSLIRTAELADIEWRPVAGKKLAKVKATAMRAALMTDNGVDVAAAWGGEMTRRRSHVMLLVGYGIALRRSELCALTVGDIKFIDSNTAEVWIQDQKTSDHGTELILHNPKNEDPAVQRIIDAVPLLRSWIDTLIELGADDSTPLFPAFDRHGNFPDGKVQAVSGQAWSDRLGELAKTARVFGALTDPRYERVTGHSLRRGFVDDACDQGVDPILIARVTRHKNINMIALYADERKARTDAVVSKLFFAIAA